MFVYVLRCDGNEGANQLVLGLQQIRRCQDLGAPPQDAGWKTLGGGATPTVALESGDSQTQHKTQGSDTKTDKGAFNETTV